MLNIDTSAQLTPEQLEAWQRLLDRAVRENRSINTYAKKKYSKPEQNEKHLLEQQNIMRLGLPTTASLWDDLDPEFELNNITPSGNNTLGELYGMFHSDPSMRKQYSQYGPAIGLNYDAIGNKTIAGMLKNLTLPDQYAGLFSKDVASTLEHEREHAYGQRRIPFGSIEDIAKQYASRWTEKDDIFQNIVKPTVDQMMKLKKEEPILFKIYSEAVQGDSEQRWGLFEEMAARAIEEDTKDPKMKQYSKWKKTGLLP